MVEEKGEVLAKVVKGFGKGQSAASYGSQSLAQRKIKSLDVVGDLPPAVVFVCGLDPLRDQGRAYAGKLIAAGTRVIFREAAGQVHGSAQLRGAIPSAQADLEGQIADLKALLA